MSDKGTRVVSLLDHREKREAETEADPEVGACRECQNQWFILRGRRNDPPIAASGAVTIDPRGMVTGYIGEPVCCECGKPWAPVGGWRNA